jgi:hypothetical protein
MKTTYKIHPAIGIARVGNSPTDFYLTPETTGDLPIKCDAEGNTGPGPEQPVTEFKDSKGRIKRQAARFRVFVYDDQSPGGRELRIGDTVQAVNLEQGGASGQVLTGTLTDIQWTAYLANKKAIWYQFQELAGEHGYAPDHPLRNANITQPDQRQNLIIDPGPQTVFYSQKSARVAQFAAGQNPGNPQSFPPPLNPNSIATLGEIRATVQDNHARLLVLGAFGNSGSSLTGLGQPKIQAFANNEGWFDDLSDGPVTAQLVINVTESDGHTIPASTMNITVGSPAWVIVGYPRYAPQIVDIVTMDDLVYDIAIRYFAYNQYLYGVPPFGCEEPPPAGEDLQVWRQAAQYNPNYYPYFWRDIWPILTRPNNYQWVMDFDAFTGGEPHNTAPGTGQAFDPDQISVPPYHGESQADKDHKRSMRMAIFKVLRRPSGENRLTTLTDRHDPDFRPYAMPYLCGDNPLSNVAASKFLRLTDTMLFMLKQWAEGKFINEKLEDLTPPVVQPGVEIDRGSLGNMLGGAFCPGGEACWIMRNPAIYSGPYRINQAPYTPGGLSQPVVVAAPTGGNITPSILAAGLEPGDITKYDAVPWQADFNECSTQPIDITYEDWNNIYPASTGDPVQSITQLTYWWPAHRPMWVSTLVPPPVLYQQGNWSPTSQNHSGDLQMVTAWASLGFVLANPAAVVGAPDPSFVNVPSGNANELPPPPPPQKAG